ncbi:hypothetical protein V6N13_012598 [Hibiscus sabdariffa]
MLQCSQKPSVFAVNGELVEFSKVDPSTTLLEFLRLRLLSRVSSLIAVKWVNGFTFYGWMDLKFLNIFFIPMISCMPGGCGACVILLSKYDPMHDKVDDFTLRELEIARMGGFHPIHGRFSGFHASQCGYCIPGMCVSLYSALVNAADKTSGPEPHACKSFAADVDIWDLTPVGEKEKVMKHENITLEELLERPQLVFNSVLLSINIPCWKCTSLFKCCLLNAFLAEVSFCKDSAAGVVVNNRGLAFGTKHSVRANNVEEFLSAKLLDGVFYTRLQLESTV